MTFIADALEIAYDAHKGQNRKDSMTPFIVHPIRVGDGIDLPDDIITAGAFNHDVIEDCDRDRVGEFRTRLMKLEPTVLALVEELTRKDPETTDKAEYLNTFATKSVRALIVKLFDRYDNVWDFRRTTMSYSRKYAAKANVLYGHVYNRRGEIAQFAGEKFGERCYNMAIMLAAYGDGHQWSDAIDMPYDDAIYKKGNK